MIFQVQVALRVLGAAATATNETSVPAVLAATQTLETPQGAHSPQPHPNLQHLTHAPLKIRSAPMRGRFCLRHGPRPMPPMSSTRDHRQPVLSTRLKCYPIPQCRTSRCSAILLPTPIIHSHPELRPRRHLLFLNPTNN